MYIVSNILQICGAMSEKGNSLSSIKKTAEKIISSMATIGVALSACSLPGMNIWKFLDYLLVCLKSIILYINLISWTAKKIVWLYLFMCL